MTDSAIPPEWGNTMNKIVTILAPKGTTIYERYAEKQVNLVGGGIQIAIRGVDSSWIII
jgi:hypothetical protein